MRYLLSRAMRPVLLRLATEKTLCAFDFDGTLAPIVEHPSQAQLRSGTRKLLAQLSAAYPCVVLSGRARADVLGKLKGVAVEQVIGNHGAESGVQDPVARDLVEGWKTVIQPEIDSLPGVWIEDKGISLALHYRQSPDSRDARPRILRAVGKLRDVRVFGGKRVINLVAAGSRHKGEALAAERNRLDCAWVLFVGDDENDEDAFALAGNVVPVRIGLSRTSKARYYLRTQAEIDELLMLLLAMRTDQPAASRLLRGGNLAESAE